MKSVTLTFYGIGIFLLLIHTLTPVVSANCGDILFFDFGEFDSLVEVREPITDCDNPFNADSPAPFTYELSLAGQVVTENSQVVLEEGVLISIDYTINKSGNFAFSPFQLFRKFGADYQQVAVSLDGSNVSVEPGEYVAVLLYETPPVFSRAEPVWKQFIKNLFLPRTAYAFFSDSTEVVAVPFTVEYPTPEPVGASSVLFLPGIQASRLYADGLLGSENRLWEPNTNSDVRKLEMTESGASVNDIYTEDIIGEVFGVFNIYKSFANELDKLRDDNQISGWQPLAYDWRYSVFDIVEYGIQYENSTVYPVEELEKLAADSLTGKVTIVAHSNGGLLAKAIMLQLEAEGKSALVDQILFVASPQLGTPKAIASILHGYKQSILQGLLVSDTTAREAIRNMPGAYGLLPSSEYILNAGEPVLFFADSASLALFRAQYGNAVNSVSELTQFLTGAEGRPVAESIEDVLLANSFIVGQTYNQSEQLNAWRAPAGIGVTEIVGVGIDTEKGFEYQEFSERVCGEPDVFGTQQCEERFFYKPIPLMTLNGDGTVVSSSAEGYRGDKETYYYNLFTEDEYEHGNILESDSIIELIINSLAEVVDNIEHIDTEKPDFANNRLMIGVHSPVSIFVSNQQNQQVGIVDGELAEEIPNSSYRELAGSKYIIVPQNVDFDVIIKGEAEGGMTLTIHELSDDSQSELSNIPIPVITASTSITFAVKNENISNILVDENGDDVTDAEFTPAGDRVLSPPVQEITYELLLSEIDSLDINKKYKKVLLLKAKLAQRMFEKSRKPVHKKIEQMMLRGLQTHLRIYFKRGVIEEVSYVKIDGVIKELKK